MVLWPHSVLCLPIADFPSYRRKKNAPYLYDVVITHALDWPSLTCQWFPDKESYVARNFRAFSRSDILHKPA